MSSHEPLISVVTPFRNTAPYLAQCIESVLAQSHRNFEYILSDNCSTDGSAEIAQNYVRKDSRIRLLRQPQLLSQVQHYNRALAQISAASHYCKIAQADDFIFPECLRLMAAAFAQSETIGLVSSYDLKANNVRGWGFPYPATMMSGREVARLYLRSKVFVFGSPNTVMYRSSVVRDHGPFFAENLLHEDTEKCMEILKHWDFAFVYQVLSFMRTENVNQSVSAEFRDFRPDELDRYIIVHRYASTFLEEQEAHQLKNATKREYYRGLAGEVLRSRDAAFWNYQEGGLKTLGEGLDRGSLALQLGRVLLGMAANPGTTVMRIFKFLKHWARTGTKKTDNRSASIVRSNNKASTTPFRMQSMQTVSPTRNAAIAPLVSVVMVVCNVERFLAESIESILSQTYDNFEFVIVDFGSTDNSKAIVAGYGSKDDRIKFYQVPHCGLAEARNAACSFAQGKYAAIMDADDVSLPERLCRQVNFMEEHPEVSILGGAVEWIDTRGIPLIVRENPMTNREIQTRLRECCPLWQPSVMVRRDAFLAAGGYRGAFAPAEDYDLWLRMAEHCEIGNLREIILRYRIHPSQVSMRKQTQQTLGILAARVSADARRSGRIDPLERVQEITPELLSQLGVSPDDFHKELVQNRRQWVGHMSMAGEVSAALEAALAIAHTDLTGVERWQRADLQLTIASLYWRQQKYIKSFLSGCRALITRPVVAGRPLKPLLQRLRWV